METRAPTHEDYLAAGRGELSAEEFKAALPHATAAVRDLIFPNEPDGSEEWARAVMAACEVDAAYGCSGGIMEGGKIYGKTSPVSYSQMVDFAQLPNGAHSFSITATDADGTAAVVNFPFTLNLSAPTAPAITQPTTGATVSVPLLNVSGTAMPGSQVQLLLNGQVSGSPVAAAANGSGHKGKMQGGHLRYKDCVRARIALAEHRHAGAGREAFCLVGIAYGQQRTDADTRRSQGVALVHFDERIQFAVGPHELAHLVGGNGIYAAAKRGKLHKLYPCVAVVGLTGPQASAVEPRRVCPLVARPQAKVHAVVYPAAGQGVLAYNSSAQRGDKVGQTVVHLWVCMVRATRKHNHCALAAQGFGIDVLCLGPQLAQVVGLLVPCSAHGSANFTPW